MCVSLECASSPKVEVTSLWNASLAMCVCDGRGHILNFLGNNHVFYMDAPSNVPDLLVV